MNWYQIKSTAVRKFNYRPIELIIFFSSWPNIKSNVIMVLVRRVCSVFLYIHMLVEHNFVLFFTTVSRLLTKTCVNIYLYNRLVFRCFFLKFCVYILQCNAHLLLAERLASRLPNTGFRTFLWFQGASYLHVKFKVSSSSRSYWEFIFLISEWVTHLVIVRLHDQCLSVYMYVCKTYHRIQLKDFS